MLIERQSQALFCWYGCFFVLFSPPSPLAATTTSPFGYKRTILYRPMEADLQLVWAIFALTRLDTIRWWLQPPPQDPSEGLGLPCWGFSFEGNFWFGLFLNLLYRKLHGGSVGRRERNP